MKASSIVVLAITLLGTIGGWLAASSAQSWSAVTSPQAVGGLLLLVGSTFGAAFGVQRRASQPEPDWNTLAKVLAADRQYVDEERQVIGFPETPGPDIVVDKEQVIAIVMADLRRNGPLRRAIMQTCRG